MIDRALHRDNGCELSPSCLRCPLPVCKYDDPNWRRRTDLNARDTRIIELRAEGLTVQGIADVVGVSDRTVYRVLLLHKRGLIDLSRKPANAPREESDGPPLLSLDEFEQWQTIGAYDFTTEELYQEAA